jgi:hypothetical protein
LVEVWLSKNNRLTVRAAPDPKPVPLSNTSSERKRPLVHLWPKLAQLPLCNCSTSTLALARTASAKAGPKGAVRVVVDDKVLEAERLEDCAKQLFEALRFLEVRAWVNVPINYW